MKAIELEKVSASGMQNLNTVNTLTAADKYYLLNRDNLTEPNQRLLSEKERTFLFLFVCFVVFFAFAKFRLNFENFLTRDDPHSRCISEIIDSEIHP